MRADELLKKYGRDLIGKVINTNPMGVYPGGMAIITEIEPDSAAPEIVFYVYHMSCGEIGVFKEEIVSLIEGDHDGQTYNEYTKTWNWL